MRAITSVKECVGPWAWLCPFLMAGVAAAVLLLFGLNFWTAITVVVLLACPAVIVWGMVKVRCQTKGHP